MRRPRRPEVLSHVAWDHVQLFLVLYRSATMAQAASTLGVNTSTVSRRLVALEESLDAVLFDRGRDGLSPTAAADDLFPMAEVVERGVFEFTHAADGLEREVEGQVRVTCPPDVADVILMPVLKKLHKRHPGLRVALEPSEATVDLNRREADLALRIVKPTRGDLIVQRALVVAWELAGSGPLAKEVAGRVEDAPWIGWTERYQHTPMARWMSQTMQAEPIVVTDSITTHVAAAKAGIGVALLPAPTVAASRLSTLGPPSGAAALPTNDLYIVTHRALRNVPRVRAVWDAVLEQFQALEV